MKKERKKQKKNEKDRLKERETNYVYCALIATGYDPKPVQSNLHSYNLF
jgi:hypothetical protein